MVLSLLCVATYPIIVLIIVLDDHDAELIGLALASATKLWRPIRNRRLAFGPYENACLDSLHNLQN